VPITNGRPWSRYLCRAQGTPLCTAGRRDAEAGRRERSCKPASAAVPAVPALLLLYLVLYLSASLSLSCACVLLLLSYSLLVRCSISLCLSMLLYVLLLYFVSSAVPAVHCARRAAPLAVAHGGVGVGVVRREDRPVQIYEGALLFVTDISCNYRDSPYKRE
jgi:hypothetical protein